MVAINVSGIVLPLVGVLVGTGDEQHVRKLPPESIVKILVIVARVYVATRTMLVRRASHQIILVARYQIVPKGPQTRREQRISCWRDIDRRCLMALIGRWGV